MLEHIAPGQSDKLLVGYETSDDAAVFSLRDDLVALLTLDFFTPIVDDPYDFGRITAANALSDIYAMGGDPLTALNIIAFPCSLGPAIVGQVLRGGSDKVAEAGAVIVGGHTIDDKEPKYGLSVFGTAHPDNVWRNVGARPGDLLVLTKPLGTGIWGTALKRSLVDSADAREVIESMAMLNRSAALALRELDVHACTDITGFGLAGHAFEMAKASVVDMTINLDILPLFMRTVEFASQKVVPGRTADVISWASGFLRFDKSVDDALKELWLDIVCDPQTSGGLFVALSAEDAHRFQEMLPDMVSIVGEVGDATQYAPGTITFR